MRSTSALVVAVLTAALLEQGCSSPRYPEEDALTPGIFLEAESRDAVPSGQEVLQVYAKGLEVTKLSEGFRSYLYNDVAHYCTIAYGHLVRHEPCSNFEPPDNFKRGLTEPEGEALLMKDMRGAERAVQASLTFRLTDGQFAALCDFVYNVGPTNFKTSRLLAVVNRGQFDQVPTQLRRWVRAGDREVEGLKTRRQREISLFFDGMPVPKAAPAFGEDTSSVDIRTGK